MILFFTGIYDLDVSNVMFCHDDNVVCLKSAATEAHQKFVKFQSRLVLYEV